MLVISHHGFAAGRESGGAFQPKPYRREGEKFRVEMPTREYLALIHEEVRSAKAYAASIAAALGGLFIAAIQVYGRIVAQT